jgi:ElaB/YqjD/DUF883 family membrane-anchored ribosome-binding protein
MPDKRVPLAVKVSNVRIKIWGQAPTWFLQSGHSSCNMNTNELTDRVGDKAEELQNQAQEKMRNIKETARDWSGKAKNTARNVGAAADLYVREYAWTTVAMVGVTALLVGFLLGRQRD